MILGAVVLGLPGVPHSNGEVTQGTEGIVLILELPRVTLIEGVKQSVTLS